MIYILLFLFLLTIELLYFKIAKEYKIIDYPNKRSSHSQGTLRGGGIVFYFAILTYFIYSGFWHPWFFIGLSIISVISFLDDILSLSKKWRILAHFLAVGVMFIDLEGLLVYPWWVLAFTFILVIGTINAHNFMDGINGITAANALTVLVLLQFCNEEIGFTDVNLIRFSLIGVMIFAFFNFRQNAKCFAGDVGSIGMAFVLIYLTLLLILKTHNPIYFLFFITYGIDTVWTIFNRLLQKENIFEAHRQHLYQYLRNEAKINKLVVAAGYGIVQFIIGTIVIYIAKIQTFYQFIFAILLIVGMSVFYFLYKRYIYLKYVLPVQ